MRQDKTKDNIKAETFLKWEDLKLSNDFLFARVMRDKELCRQVLETILGVRIFGLHYLEEQKAIDLTMDGKSVRLDVYVEDLEQVVYNVEMQAAAHGDLPKRSRYYQAMLDLNMLEKGMEYQQLKQSYVIFICTFDPFRLGHSVYTFVNGCAENAGLLLGDGAVKIFLNAGGDGSGHRDVTKELAAFLDYVATGIPTEDALVQKLDAAVKKAKVNQEWRREYMTLYMRDQENRILGEQKAMLLMTRLLADGRIEEIGRAASDADARASLYDEYGITDMD